MSNVTFVNKNTTADAVAQYSRFTPEMWEKSIMYWEYQRDFWGDFEGPGQTSVIRTKTDFSKNAGQSLFLRTGGQYYGNAPAFGEEQLTDGEKDRVNGFNLKVNHERYRADTNRNYVQQTGLLSTEADISRKLGEMTGFLKSERADMRLLKQSRPLVINNKTSVDSIRSVDTLSWNSIINGGAVLKSMGAKPAKIAKDGQGSDIFKYYVVAIGDSVANFQGSSDYKEKATFAGVRGVQNLIFTGGVDEVGGQMLLDRPVQDHGDYGPIGSPQIHKAFLGTAIASADAADLMYGGGDPTSQSQSNYYRYFSNAAYRYTATETLAAVTNIDRFAITYNDPSLVDASGAPIAGADGKIGFIKYRVNDGNKLTILQRLYSADGTYQKLTVGSVTYGSGHWDAAILTDAYCQGATIVETNAYGVPLAWTFFCGQQAIARGWGSERNQVDQEDFNGKFFKNIYISNIWGDCLPARNDGKKVNSLVMVHAVNLPNLPAPWVD